MHWGWGGRRDGESILLKVGSFFHCYSFAKFVCLLVTSRGMPFANLKKTMNYEIILTVYLYGEYLGQNRDATHSLLIQDLFCRGLNLVLLNKIQP